MTDAMTARIDNPVCEGDDIPLVRERIKDDLAVNGMTEDDVRELIQKLEGSDKRHLRRRIIVSTG
jgi:hypothetical protein